MQSSAIFILNRQEKVINILNNVDSPNRNPFFDDILTQTLSTGADTYKFTTTFNQKNSRSITVGNKVAFMLDGKYMLFQIVSVNDIHGDNLEMEVYCESAGLSLINSVCRGQKIVSCDVKKFLEAILQDTEWNVGFVDMSLSNTFDLDLETASVYSLLQNNIKKYDAEIRFRCEMVNGRISKKFIDVFRIRGRVSGKRFEFGKNVESISREIDSSELFTALIGEGKNGLNFSDISLEDVPNKPQGQDFVFDQEAYNRYNQNGYHLMGVFKYETESKEELLRETYKKLQECKNPKIKYTVNVSLLGKDVEVGETVNIIDRFFEPPLLLQARVSKLEKSLTDNSNVRCELSNFVEVSSNINIELLNKVKDFVDNSITDRFPIGTNDIQDGAVTGQKIYENSITTDHLIAGVVTADKIHAESIKANHIAANQVKAQHIEAGAIDATKIQAESIESEHIVANAIKSEHIDTGSITTDKIEAGSITAEKIQTGAITAGSGIIAEGAIGSAQISSLEANKINTGTIDTSLVNIAGPDGNMEITGNQLLVNNKGKNRVIVGEYRTDEEGETKYGLLVRGEDDTTIMIDERGVHNAGITDGAIDNNKVSDNANISGNKLDINSVIREVNENGTESIKGTKVVVGDRSLEVELSEQKIAISEQGKEISSQKSEIQALDDQIKLKVDNQTFTEATQTINQSIGSAIETSKAYTNAEISTVDKKLEKNTSEIKILKDEISTKVSQVDIDKTIQNIQIGGRNLLTENILNKFYGSAVKSGNEWTLSSNGEVSYFQNDNVLLNQEKGSEFTFSASIKCLSESISKKVRITVWHDGNWDDYYIQDELTNEYKRFSKTVKLKNNSKIGLCIQIDGVNRADDRIMFKELKLERGNKATDWSPAPEDVDKAIVDKVGVVSEKISSVESKLTQDLDGIKLNVSGLDSKTTQLETNITTVNRDLTGKINSGVQSAKDYATNQANSAKQQAISTSAQDATNKANQAQQNAINSSKEYTNVQISSTNSKVSEVQSSLNVLKEKVETKVSQSDIDKSISDIKFGDRNLFSELNLGSHGCLISKLSNLYMNIPTYNIVVNKPNQGNNFGFNIKNPIKMDGGKGVNFALSFNYKINKYINEISMHGYVRVFYKDGSKQDFDYSSKIVNCKESSNWNKWLNINYTFKTDSNKEIDNIGAFYFYTDLAEDGTNFDFTVPMFIIGNVVGDWSPCQDDLDSKVQDSIKITDEKINKVSSTVTQLKDSVTTEISSLKSKTQTIESNLDGKASKSEVQELNTQVAQQKVSLDGITNRVGQTETKTTQIESNLSGVSNKVNSVESSLNILKDKVETKVSKEEVQESISKIDIGGRNLIRNSNFKDGLNYFNINNGSGSGSIELVEFQGRKCLKFTDVSSYRISKYIGVVASGFKAGRNVTVSADFYITKGNYICFDTSHALGVEYMYINFEEMNKWKRLSLTSKKKTNADGEIRFAIYGSEDVPVSGYISLIKVEEGNKPTDWSPAPEDVDKLVADNVQIVDSKISSVSSSVTQLRDSVNTQISSLNSKTQSLQSSLDGKASKQEVSEVSNRVTSIDANLQGITQRVSNTESKTQSLESSLGGKASVSEVQNIKNQVASVEVNLNGITNRVQSTETNVNRLDGKIQNTVAKSEFTEFKQNVDGFKLKVQKGYGGNNLIKNSGFLNGYANWFVTEYQWNGSNSSVAVWGDSSEWVMSGTNALVIRGTNGSQGAYGIRQENIKLKPNTTYTISGYAAVHRGKWRMSLAQNDWGWIASARGVSSGGKNPNNWDRFEVTFTTGPAYDYLTNCKLDLMLEEAQHDAYVWFTNLVLNEGSFPIKWQPKGGETYGNTMNVDENGLQCNFEDGSYSKMGRGGFEWYNAGTGHRYHCLMTTGVVNHLDFNGGNRHHRITLPQEFRGKKFKVQSMIQGWNFPSGSVSGTMASGVQDFDYNTGQFTLYFNGGGDWKTNTNIAYVVIA